MSLMIQQKTISAPSVQELNSIMTLCKELANSKFYANLGLGGVLAIYMTAKEMNLPVMSCLNGGMYNISGKVSLSSNLMNMMIVNAGHRVDVIENTDKICTLNFIRSDRREEGYKGFKYTFTIEMAKRANLLGKDNWRMYPEAMLFSRCMSAGAKIHMPDVLLGCYVHGEIEETQYEEITQSKKEEMSSSHIFEKRSTTTTDSTQCKADLLQAETLPTITQDQALEVFEIFKQFPDIKDRLEKFMNDQKIESAFDLTPQIYGHIKKAVEQKMSEKHVENILPTPAICSTSDCEATE